MNEKRTWNRKDGSNMKNRALVMLLALALVLSSAGCANEPAEGESSSSTITQEEYDALKEQNEKLQAELDELKGETDEETESDTESGSSSEAENTSTPDGSSSTSSTSSQSSTPATSGSSQSSAQQSSSQSSAPASTSSQSSAQSQSGSSTPAPQKTTSSSGKGPLAKYTVRVSDSSTPATDVQGELYNGELAYVFYSSSGKVLGTVPDSVISQILWDNNLTQAEDDEQKSWFVENFNIYRGLDGGSYEGGSGSTSGGSSSSSGEIDIEEFREEVIRLTNIEREKAGLDPLVEDSTAMEYAQIRAEELAESYSHVRPNGDGTGSYSHYNFNENIAKGIGTPQDVIDSWMGSPNHKASMLGDYSDYGNCFGVGVYKANGTIYWVQEFIGWDSEG